MLYLLNFSSKETLLIVKNKLKYKEYLICTSVLVNEKMIDQIQQRLPKRLLI